MIRSLTLRANLSLKSSEKTNLFKVLCCRILNVMAMQNEAINIHTFRYTQHMCYAIFLYCLLPFTPFINLELIIRGLEL